MEIVKTDIDGLLVIKPDVFADSRGFFKETYSLQRYHEAGIKADFVQDNISKSTYGVVRGLHFQQGEHSQAKLVQVICGKVFDVALDLRRSSPTFGKWFGIELSDENHRQFFIPRGFAHGFSVLSDVAIFNYKCDNLYNKQSERGILFCDSWLNVNWQIPDNSMIISDKDKILPTWADMQNEELF